MNKSDQAAIGILAEQVISGRPPALVNEIFGFGKKKQSQDVNDGREAPVEQQAPVQSYSKAKSSLGFYENVEGQLKLVGGARSSDDEHATLWIDGLIRDCVVMRTGKKEVIMEVLITAKQTGFAETHAGNMIQLADGWRDSGVAHEFYEVLEIHVGTDKNNQPIISTVAQAAQELGIQLPEPKMANNELASKLRTSTPMGGGNDYKMD